MLTLPESPPVSPVLPPEVPGSPVFSPVLPLPPAPEGLFQKGHGDYHQPDEAISLKRVEMALVIYIKGILEICRKVTL